jgi:protein phosphatase
MSQRKAISQIDLPELCLVVLVGASGSGKSTFARKHFLPTEILSSDYFRGLVSDDENSQAATKDAFESLYYIASKRLANSKLTVVDATNVRPEDRKGFVQLAKEFHCFAVAIVLDMPERLCQDRNRDRPERDFGPHVVRSHVSNLRRNLRGLEREGFRFVHILSTPEEAEAVGIARTPLWNNRKHEHGPFDIIGDVHGCFDELQSLLGNLGYQPAELPLDDEFWGNVTWSHPSGRKALFVGDLVDRGPCVLDTIRLVHNMVGAGSALCVPGNHDVKLVRALRGKQVKIAHGLEQSLAELDQIAEDLRPAAKRQTADFLDSLVSHFVLDDGKLVLAHAGLRQEMQGRGSAAVREFALYGETTGETDEFGLPIRYNWASEYRGPAVVVYGHTPVPEPEWLNNTINIDTGCVFGGRLTALRYPERELVSVNAAREYAVPLRPLKGESAKLTAQQEHDDILVIDDVIGKRIVETELHGRITIREENAIAALEVMSRFAADPRWLIYLPPTMSPCETSTLPDLLEHPEQAFEYFERQGIETVVCEEKHMGSRAVVIVCQDGGVARRRFGVDRECLGVCYTRTGRPFFSDEQFETEFLASIQAAVNASGFWQSFETDWVCLDAELMPWSAKAQDLIRKQYAAVGAASKAAYESANQALQMAAARGVDVETLLSSSIEREQMAAHYRESYRRYCWPVASLADFRLAPFHIIAAEGKHFLDQPHQWHMQQLGQICAKNPDLLLATPHISFELADSVARASAIEWWETLTGRGGEGMVVKPKDFIARGRRGLVQPAMKVRGREYLRIIYGPEYTGPDQLERLRSRSLSSKRSLALREFALGVEGIRRFIGRDPLRRVHECVFGVLALESEPVDPRL